MDNHDYRQKLAARLATLRVQHNRTLEALSSVSGISRATLSRIERGEVSPTAEVLNQLCIVYGMTMSRLLAEVEQAADNLFTVQGLEQYIWLSAGGVTITVDTETWTLKKGDSLRFHLSGTSSFSAHQSLGAHYLLVVCKS